jgi:lipopolysaccharide transport system permease protein
MMAYYRIAPGPSLLLLPVVFGAIWLAAMGIGTFLAALNVAYRDVRYVIPFLVQVWMFATPTVYMQPKPSSNEWARILLGLNPMTALIATFRSAALGGPIAWDQFGAASAMVVLAFLLGCLYFRRVEDSFADII